MSVFLEALKTQFLRLALRPGSCHDEPQDVSTELQARFVEAQKLYGTAPSKKKGSRA